jgi:hypothetical protein
MAINQNHLFDDLDGKKCAIVEKGITGERLEFLTKLLQHNGFTVVAVPATAPRVAADQETSEPAQTPELFNLGVTDVRFNVINAIYGRLLRSHDGRVVTMDYWTQKNPVSDDSIPYFSKEQ